MTACRRPWCMGAKTMPRVQQLTAVPGSSCCVRPRPGCPGSTAPSRSPSRASRGWRWPASPSSLSGPRTPMPACVWRPTGHRYRAGRPGGGGLLRQRIVLQAAARADAAMVAAGPGPARRRDPRPRGRALREADGRFCVGPAGPPAGGVPATRSTSPQAAHLPSRSSGGSPAARPRAQAAHRHERRSTARPTCPASTHC